MNQRGYLLLLFTYGCRRRAMLSSLTTLVNLLNEQPLVHVHCECMINIVNIMMTKTFVIADFQCRTGITASGR